MTDVFELALGLVLEHEGGYVNDPADPGGETIYGISRRAHPAAWANGAPSVRQAAAIYRADYWDPIRCDELPAGLAVFLFDTAVNVGCRQAARLLQRVLRVTDDGVIGPMTIKAARAAEQDGLLSRLAAERLAHYAALSTWQRFGRGWSARTVATAMACAQLSTGG